MLRHVFGLSEQTYCQKYTFKTLLLFVFYHNCHVFGGKLRPDHISRPNFMSSLPAFYFWHGQLEGILPFLPGAPPLRVLWFHNNVEITQDSPHFLLASLGHIHTLTLLHATSESSGEYVCEAYNEFGDTDTFCFIEVRGICSVILSVFK